MTIYRRWPNKAAVVMDSLLALVGPETSFPEGKDALQSMRLQLDLQATFFRGPRGNLIRSVVAEAQSDPEMAAAFRDRWLAPRREEVRKMLRQGMKEGSLRKDLDLDTAIDLLYGSFYYRLLLGTGHLDEHFIESTYQQFLRGHQVP